MSINGGKEAPEEGGVAGLRGKVWGGRQMLAGFALDEIKTSEPISK